MSNKLNCWEFKKCGKEAVCPAARESRLNGINGGKNGGRACWVVAGTLCGGKVQGVYAQKLGNCLECDFYKKVRTEEGQHFKTGQDLLDLLK